MLPDSSCGPRQGCFHGDATCLRSCAPGIWKRTASTLDPGLGETCFPSQPWISRNNLHILWQLLRESQTIPAFICSVCSASLRIDVPRENSGKTGQAEHHTLLSQGALLRWSCYASCFFSPDCSQLDWTTKSYEPSLLVLQGHWTLEHNVFLASGSLCRQSGEEKQT